MKRACNDRVRREPAAETRTWMPGGRERRKKTEKKKPMMTAVSKTCATGRKLCVAGDDRCCVFSVRVLRHQPRSPRGAWRRIKMQVIDEQLNHMRIKFFLEYDEFKQRAKDFDLDWEANKTRYRREYAADRCVEPLPPTLSAKQQLSAGRRAVEVFS